ncbi:MAG: hypothetical protein H6843_15710 [Rhodospirillaceae bacterium]|nr:hypothetical protein [Rhodospirillaceae bacterium]
MADHDTPNAAADPESAGDRKVHPGESAYHRHLAEVEFARHMHSVPLRAAIRAVLAGTVVGLLVGSDELRTWSTYLPVEYGIRDFAYAATTWWHGQMQALGTAEVFPWIREQFRAFQYFTLS